LIRFDVESVSAAGLRARPLLLLESEPTSLNFFAPLAPSTSPYSPSKTGVNALLSGKVGARTSAFTCAFDALWRRVKG